MMATKKKQPTAKPKVVPIEDRYAKDRRGVLLLRGSVWKTTAAKSQKAEKFTDGAGDKPVTVLSVYAFVVFRKTFHMKDERSVVFSCKARLLSRNIYAREEVFDTQAALTAMADLSVGMALQREWRFIEGDWPQLATSEFGVWE